MKIRIVIVYFLVALFFLCSCTGMPFTGDPFEHNLPGTEFDVDEGDIIKVHNDYIFKLTNDGLHIIHTNDGEMKKTAFLPMDIVDLEEKEGNRIIIFLLGAVKYDIIIHDNKLVLINLRIEEYTVNQDEEEVTKYDYFTDVEIFDLTTLTPNGFDFDAERSFTFQGAYRTAKIYDNKMYFISHLLDWDSQETPYFIEDSQTYDIDDSYKISENSKGIAMFSLVSLNGQEDTKSMAIYGRINELSFFYDAMYPIFYEDSTNIIIKLDIDTLDFVGRISDAGYSLLNRYCIQDDGEHIFIATYHVELGSKLSVYNRENMEFIASVENIAPGEDLMSARFASDFCYLVTYKDIDPVFKIDISNPEQPFIADELEIAGFSSYLHMIEESSLAIGIGYNDSWEQKVTLFDVFEESVTEIKSIESYMMIYGHAPRDPRFAFIDRSRNLLILTTLGLNYERANIYDNQEEDEEDKISQEEFYHNIVIFEYSQDDLIIKKVISEKAQGDIFEDMQTFESYMSARIVAIGDYMYCATNLKITSYNLDSLERVKRIYL